MFETYTMTIADTKFRNSEGEMPCDFCGGYSEWWSDGWGISCCGNIPCKAAFEKMIKKGPE